MVDVKGLKAEPPPIFVSKQPALLVQTDGPPAFAPVKGTSGLSFLVNTNWDIFRVEEGGALYLRDDTRWLTASSLEVPWAPYPPFRRFYRRCPTSRNGRMRGPPQSPSHIRQGAYRALSSLRLRPSSS